MCTFAELVSLDVSVGFLGQHVHVLQGSEEHAQVVRRLHQFHDHADGLIVHITVDDDFTFFLI